MESHGEKLKVISLHHVFLAFDFHPPNVLPPCLVHSQVQFSHVALVALLTPIQSQLEVDDV
jgi:hypothetical protein